ncbi:methyl-accepting chemotaxis protein [Jannaschia sp. CCS1]|uniref:methyl-accepting chemotaxis protein n=1 Tax=Jannaschia sp. (strain CCS1) TaxID=290400 RepID=UPI000053A8C7|nr:methyl-accepting chemotaxis protein [Jannaschia sp. CCS1]ABD56277.1 methyl-accepting chemotaxis sensory transducer [Jannaschia sp. CCS1]
MFLANMTLKTKLIVTIAAMLILLAGVLGYLGTQKIQAALNESISAEERAGIRALVYTLQTSHAALTQHAGADAGGFEITWPRMPNTLMFDDVDAASAISGLKPTVFHFDAETGDFMRIATTMREENGNRSVATPLARGPVYDALINGETFSGAAEVRGHLFRALYVPVFDGTGAIVGAFAVGRPIETLTAMIRQNMIETLLVTLGILTVMVLVAFFSIRNMLAPLTHVARSLGKLSEGTLDEDIGHQNRNDEIGKISKAMVVLQESMQTAEELKAADVERSTIVAAKQQEQDIVVTALTQGLSRLGNLDLTQQIENTPEAPFPADYEELRTSYNMLLDNLSESVEAIRDVATEVSHDAREMAEASSDLSSRTESQAATLEQSAAALEEMSASVLSTAANASDAETTTQENRTNAKRTGEIVDTAIKAMSAIEESSKKITQIISVIDDIAFQTNLLALNAGVEAARAGEAGRGFAVVASEVRALAQHSSASAQEIKGLIASSSDHVDNGSKLVHDAGRSINDIIDRVDRVTSLVSDIAVSAKEQSIGVTEINAAVRDLDTATQGNAAMAEETSAASEGLTNAADRLASHLARFKLADASDANWAAAAATAPAARAADGPQDADAFAPPSPAIGGTRSASTAPVNAFQDF